LHDYALGGGAALKVYWVTAGLGVAVTLGGGLVYGMSDHKYGLIMILGGMVVAIMALVMRLVESAMTNSKSKPND
jgi:hypothetical protein